MLPAAIESIKQAFKEIKRFCIEDWEGEYRVAARDALKQILESRMQNWVDAALQNLLAQDVADRRNGSFPRHLLTELGDLQLAIPRTRTFSAISLLRQMGRRPCRADDSAVLCLGAVHPQSRAGAFAERSAGNHRLSPGSFGIADGVGGLLKRSVPKRAQGGGSQTDCGGWRQGAWGRAAFRVWAGAGAVMLGA